MKKLLALLMALAMVLSLAACGSSSSDDDDSSESTDDSTETTETDDDSSSSAADDTVYNLSFSMHTAADSTVGQMFQDIFDEISEKTDGHVNITIYGSATLASASDVADFVSDGGADMGWLFTSFYYGQYPLTDVISVPMQGAETCEQGTQVLWDLYETYDEMAAEWSGYKTLLMYANPVSFVYSSEEISSISDISGLSIRSSSGGVAEVLANWGANVISMAPNEIYDSISKNNIQGYTAEPTMIIDYSLTEVTPYMLDVGLYQAAFVFIMNQETYDSLPAEYQAVLDEYATREASVELAALMDEYVEETLQEHIDAGLEIITPTDEAYAEFQEIADAYVDVWVEENGSDDFDAQAYYDFCASAYETYAE